MSAVSAADLAGHAFLRGMAAEHVARLAEVASVVSVPVGYRFFEEGANARLFWLVRTGHVVLDLHVSSGRERLIVETISDGDLMGISWQAEPHEWQYGAEAVQPTEAFEFDGPAVLALCDSDQVLGYQFTRRLLTVAARRLYASRIRMLDLYAAPDRNGGAR
jgi:CRP-like cAMP-binding protein